MAATGRISSIITHPHTAPPSIQPDPSKADPVTVTSGAFHDVIKSRRLLHQHSLICLDGLPLIRYRNDNQDCIFAKGGYYAAPDRTWCDFIRASPPP
jgi:hypothetical protein